MRILFSTIVFFDKECLKHREKMLSFSATNTPYSEEKWQKIFNGGMQNFTGKNWNSVISGYPEAPSGKIQVSELIKDRRYKEFIKDEPQNFFLGLESAFQAIADNPVLVKEVLEQDRRRIHLPFKNGNGEKFVVSIFRWNKKKSAPKLHADVNYFSYERAWFMKNGNAVAIPSYSN